MKLYNIKDINRFFEIVDSCKGKVFIISPQGDRFNLKSNLTKYIAFTNLFSDDSIVGELELEVEYPEDGQAFIKFMME